MFLSNALHEGISFGLCPEPGSAKAISAPGNQRYELLIALLDNSVSCTERFGALPLENPEQGRYEINGGLPAIDVVRAIEKEVGRRLDRPRVMGTTGIDVDGRLIDVRLA